MDYLKKSNDDLKMSNFSKEDTRMTLSKTYKSNSLRNLASMSLRESKQSYNFEELFQGILKRMRFFERPDIIPYPYNELYSGDKLSRLAKEADGNGLSGLNSNRKGKKLVKFSDKNRQSRGRKDKNSSSKAKTSRSTSKNKNFDCDFHSHHGIQCDTCVRLHGHKWAIIED